MFGSMVWNTINKRNPTDTRYRELPILPMLNGKSIAPVRIGNVSFATFELLLLHRVLLLVAGALAESRGGKKKRHTPQLLLRQISRSTFSDYTASWLYVSVSSSIRARVVTFASLRNVVRSLIGHTLIADSTKAPRSPRARVAFEPERPANVALDGPLFTIIVIPVFRRTRAIRQPHSALNTTRTGVRVLTSYGLDRGVKRARRDQS